MASFQTMSGFGPLGHSNKISKSRPRTTVKPILKKLAQTQSEKNSLDLDRGWDDQDDQYQYSHSQNQSHSRSISGTSHVSVATSNSGNGAPAPRQAGATFVHPFQQTPRTATPPLSYANSLASFVDSRDYSPTITEDDDIDNTDSAQSPNSLLIQQSTNNHHHQQQQQKHYQQPTNSHSHSQPSLSLQHRPSLSTHRTSSYTDVTRPQPPLRINTSRTMSNTPAQSSRLANVSSRSDLQFEYSSESPESADVMSASIGSPSSSVAPMSPLRSSFDASGFPRLRAKSDLDTATRAEHLRDARRKFEMRERAKEEKYAREEIKRRERADNKRAHEMEKQAAALHREQMMARARQEAAELEEAMPRAKHGRISMASSGRPSMSMSRPSMSMSRPSLSLARPSMSRRNTSNPTELPEKFLSSKYDSLDPESPPAFGNEAGGAQDVVFQSSKRRRTAKKKTQSSWNMFLLWLRTKLLRVNKDR